MASNRLYYGHFGKRVRVLAETLKKQDTKMQKHLNFLISVWVLLFNFALASGAASVGGEIVNGRGWRVKEIWEYE